MRQMSMRTDLQAADGASPTGRECQGTEYKHYKYYVTRCHVSTAAGEGPCIPSLPKKPCRAATLTLSLVDDDSRSSQPIRVFM
jgi:hypothetical protein